MKFKLGRFASWPSLCSDVDVVNRNEKRSCRKSLLSQKCESSTLIQRNSMNGESSFPDVCFFSSSAEEQPKHSSSCVEEKSEIVEEKCRNDEDLISLNDDVARPSDVVLANCEESLANCEEMSEKVFRSNDLVDDDTLSSDEEDFVVDHLNSSKEEDLRKNSSDAEEKASKEKPSLALELCFENNNSNKLESQFLSIIEEKEESDSYRSREDASAISPKRTDSFEVLPVKQRRSVHSNSSPKVARSLLHRLSVPEMTIFNNNRRSSSTQDISADDDAITDDDDEGGRLRRSSLISRRKVSVSSFAIAGDDARRRVTHCDSNTSTSIDDDVLINVDETPASKSGTLKKLDRSFSVSTPSITEAGNAKPINQSGVVAFENNSNVSNELVVPRANKVKHLRTPSLYVPSITPRLPLMGLLPGSTRRPSEKPSEPKDKAVKEKEKRSFFRPRAKSKEKKPHSWIKVACSNSDCCEVCAKALANTDAYQCNECLSSVHSHCKEHLEKTPCTKLKHPKNAKSSNHYSMSFPEKPKSLVGRYSSLKTEPVLTFRAGTAIRSDSSNSLLAIDEKPNGYPMGFYPSTKPGSHWDELNLWVEDADAWSASCGKTEKKKLSTKEVKRQDIIHELYITEKHHCQTLVVLKHTYYDAMAMHKILSIEDLNVLLPRLDDLLYIHEKFFRLLKQRKDEATIVDIIHDVFMSQFTGEAALKMVEAYTKFCSQKDATDRVLQDMNLTCLPYQNLIKSISSSGFYKSRSLRDCLLLVTQRLSKYHSFVENLRKNTTEDTPDKEGMLSAEKAVKEVIMAVDAGIERIQLNDFRFRVANGMDPKSFITFNQIPFCPRDLLSEERQLLYHTNVQWPNAKRHPADVVFLLFTDIIVFVERTSNGQFQFFSQDGKSGVISIRKMIVRDKAGKLGSDGVYLIATYPKPEMYEVRCKTKKENVVLMNRVQKAVDSCPYIAPPVAEIVEPSTSASSLSGKEQQDLQVLFDKLPETHEKLKSYFDEVIQIYEDISQYVGKITPRIKNNEDKEKIANLVRSCMDSYLMSIQPNTIAANLFGLAAKDKVQQQVSFVVCEDSEASSSSSTDNMVLRSHTFHGRVGHSIRRRGLRKHPTISGISASEVRTITTQPSSGSLKLDGSSCESIIEENADRTDSGISVSSSTTSMKDVTFTLLKHLSETKVELTRLRETNARLEVELALANEKAQQQRVKQTATAADNYQTLDQLRTMQANLAKEKKEYAQTIQDKEFEFNRREKMLNDQEAKLKGQDEDLRARWDKLYQVWEQQQVNGLPVSPLTATVNGELRRSNSVLTSASTSCAKSLTSVTSPPFSRPSACPGHLQGSLVHGRYADEAPKTVLPHHLMKAPSGGVSESLTSKFNALGRSSTKKKWHSTSKLTKPNEEPQQIIPSKLATKKK